MSVFALDLSTNSGYAIFDDGKLFDYGVFSVETEDYVADVKSFADLPDSFPNNLMSTARKVSEKVGILYDSYADKRDDIHVIIENVELGRQRISQQLLNYIHYDVIKELAKRDVKPRYVLVSDWRKVVKCYVKEWPEYIKYNRKVYSAKRVAKPNKAGARVAKIDGKIVSRVDQKKLSVIIANKTHNIDISNHNIADAINIGYAAHSLLNIK